MIKSITLKDYCCHKDFTAEFEAGINCIVGANGSGKSSVVSAIYGGLTNSYDHPEGMKGTVRQGATEAKITIETDEFTLTREIGEKNKHLLKVEDETFRAAKDIENVLITRFNIVKAILDKFVFIRQGRFTDIIGLSDADRAKTLAHLSSVEYFEALWKKLAEEIKLHESHLSAGPSFDENSLLAQISEVQEAITKGKTLLMRADAEVNARETVNWQEKLDALQWLNSAKALVVNYTAELAKLTAQLETAEQAEYTAKVSYLALDDKLKKLQLSNDELVAVQAFQDYLVRYPVLAGLQQEQAALQEFLKTYDKAALQQENANLTAQKNEVGERITKLRMQLALAQKASQGQDCEVCGAPPEAQFKGNPIVINNTLNKLDGDYKQLDAAIARNAHAMYLNDNKVVRLQEVEKQIAGMQLAFSVEDNRPYYDSLNARYQDYLSTLAQTDQAKNKLNNATLHKQTILEQHSSIKFQLEQNLQTLQNTVQIEAEAATAQIKIDELNNFKIERAGHQAVLTEKHNHLASLQDLLKQVQQKKGQKKLQKYVDLLTEVRALTHRNNIPHIISKRFLDGLIVGINSYLEQFEAPFRALVGEDLSFRAEMDSGAIVPATILSGGQKCLLSMAFWLSVFQGDLLVLDEPGDGLDAENRKIFNEVLAKVDSLFKKRGQQLLIISHDNQLIGNFHTIAV